MKFWKDLDCTIPAQDGDRVAAITEFGDETSMMSQPDPAKRPRVWIDSATESDRFKMEVGGRK